MGKKSQPCGELKEKASRLESKEGEGEGPSINTAQEKKKKEVLLDPAQSKGGGGRGGTNYAGEKRRVAAIVRVRRGKGVFLSAK